MAERPFFFRRLKMGHYYKQDGSPCYEVTSTKGTLRPTTVADARKLNLNPSVTTVTSLLDKPFLTPWLINEAIVAAAELPYADNVDFQKWKTDIKKMTNMKTWTAQKRGTDVHNALEKHFSGELNHDRKFDSVINKVEEILCDEFGPVPWISEQSFSRDGYGGAVDLHNDDVILDFKIKCKEDISKLKPYDDHGMQIAAYRHGLDKPSAKCYNLYINVDDNYQYVSHKLHNWNEETLKRCHEMFFLLRDFWYLSNKVERRI